jgi:hypothetical protein
LLPDHRSAVHRKVRGTVPACDEAYETEKKGERTTTYITASSTEERQRQQKTITGQDRTGQDRTG